LQIPTCRGQEKKNKICRKSNHFIENPAFYCSFSPMNRYLQLDKKKQKSRLCKNLLKIYAMLKAKNLSADLSFCIIKKLIGG
jgi:hypothetical protein